MVVVVGSDSGLGRLDWTAWWEDGRGRWTFFFSSLPFL